MILNTVAILTLLLTAQAEGIPKLALQNAYVSVYRTEVASGRVVSIPHPRKDNIAIRIDKNAPAKVEFFPGGSASSIAGGDKEEEIVVIELQRHWDAEMKVCAFPASCVRPVKVGGAEIGATESLFTNGFVSAFRHRIDKGGTLSSSYYSAKGKDRIVFIPLTNLHASFDGTEEDLKPGQAYFSEAKEVEVTAADNLARWIVIRLNTPQHRE